MILSNYYLTIKLFKGVATNSKTISMGNKKNKKKEVPGQKTGKNTAAIDERWKHATEIQPPDTNPYKMDNERNIDRFLKYGMKRKKRIVPFKLRNRK